ncbi:MAG: glycosyltransferase family 4 protein [Patescibacteria group bacterium]
MKVAHIVSTFPPYSGGMGNVCYQQVKELANLGHDVVVFTPEYNKEYNKEKLTTDNLQLTTLKPILKYGNAAFVPQVMRYLKDFEIIHLHWPFIGAEAVLFWKLFKNHSNQRTYPNTTNTPPRLVVQYQMDLVGQGIFRGIFNFYQLLFIPLMVKAADKIIVSSLDYAQNSRLKNFLLKYPGKFIEIPLGVDINKFYPREKNQDLIKKYNLSPDEKIILFVGSLDKAHYFKGLSVLLSAVADLRLKISDLRLLIVGEGNLQPKYKKLAHNLGIGERVIFAGRVPDKELPDYYNLSDIFILPSIDKSEAFGLVLLEAMACTKPIIVSDLPGPRTLVRENINGLLFKIGDSDDMAQKIKFLLENENLIQEWGRAGREIVEQNYSWSIVCQRIDKLYFLVYYSRE